MELSFQAILFIIGGVVVGWFLSFIKSRFEVSKYKKEIKEYKEHLNRQMKITNEGNKNLEDELKQFKKENENLRITVQTLVQKPGRAEIKLLNIYDSALRKMQMRAPGFSSAWEMSLQEAESEYEANETGLKSIIRKVFKPSLSQSTEQKVREISDLEQGDENK